MMLIGGAAWCGRASREPMYKGRPIGEIMDAPGLDNQDARDAFRVFGTNMVPYIRAGLRAEDTLGRRTLLWAAAKAPWLKIRVQPQPWSTM